jgi:arylsulfatase A-like enzyme
LPAVSKHVLAQRWPWFVAAAVIVAAFVGFVLSLRSSAAWDNRPRGGVAEIETLRERKDVNVLFILIDTLRAERLGSYGSTRDTAPLLDHLAHTGVRFAHHLAQSTWTKSSMASIWTGLYPTRTGINRYDDVIPEVAQMPAEVLRDAGFRTFGLWRNGWVSPTFGFDQGFDVYQRPIATPLPPNVRRENPTLNERGTDQSLIEAAIEFMRVSGQQRWFLYLHLMDLHEYIYDAESALFGSSHSDIYDNSIRWTDDSLGFLLAALGELGLLDRTIIVIVSDHGEAFLERGVEGHARDVYRETTEVPFILALPFRLAPGIVVKTRTQNVDVWPTLYDLLGVEAPKRVDGRSLVPEIVAAAEGKPSPGGEQQAYADLDQTWAERDLASLPTIAVVDGPFRYVRVNRADGEPAIEHLFDARSDPRELQNRAESEKETFERLRKAADAYAAKKPDWGEAPTREIDELELNLLRALGYKVQ